MRKFLVANRLIIIGGSAAFTLSTLASAMKPVLLIRLIQQAGFNEVMAGLAVGAPFIGMAVASVLVNPLLRVMTSRQLVLLSAIIGVAAHLISASMFQQAAVVFVAQLFSGLAVGVFLGLSSIVIGRQKRADLMFGVVDTVAVFLMSLLIASTAYAVSQLGVSGGYLYAALITALLVPLLWVLIQQHMDIDAIEEQAGEVQLSNVLRGCAVLLMGTIFITSTGLGFAFAFNIAAELDIEFIDFGGTLGLAALFAALGPVVGGFSAVRWGRRKPLLFGIVFATVSWSAFILAPSREIFLFAIFPAMFFMNVCIPMLLGAAAELDGSGAWSAIAAPLYVAGFALSPIIGGFVVSALDLDALATATIIGGIMCVLLQFALNRRPIRHEVIVRPGA